MTDRFALRVLFCAALLPVSMLAQPPQSGGRGEPQPEFMRAAQAAMREGKLEEALAVFQKELAANPN